MANLLNSGPSPQTNFTRDMHSTFGDSSPDKFSWQSPPSLPPLSQNPACLAQLTKLLICVPVWSVDGVQGLMESPKHGAPPLSGTGLSHCRDWWPSAHGPQGDQEPSTTTETRGRYVGWHHPNLASWSDDADTLLQYLIAPIERGRGHMGMACPLMGPIGSQVRNASKFSLQFGAHWHSLISSSTTQKLNHQRVVSDPLKPWTNVHHYKTHLLLQTLGLARQCRSRPIKQDIWVQKHWLWPWKKEDWQPHLSHQTRSSVC